MDQLKQLLNNALATLHAESLTRKAHDARHAEIIASKDAENKRLLALVASKDVKISHLQRDLKEMTERLHRLQASAALVNDSGEHSRSLKRGASAMDDKEERPALKCGSCHRLCHTLDKCVFPDRNGTIYGCPICNNSNHLVDECSKWSHLSEAERFRILFNGRANRPCLATKMDWVKFAKGVVERELDFSVSWVKSFPWTPWTPEFGRSVFHDRGLYQQLKEYDEYGYGFEKLPKDTTINDFDMFLKIAGAQTIGRNGQGQS